MDRDVAEQLDEALRVAGVFGKRRELVYALLEDTLYDESLTNE